VHQIAAVPDDQPRIGEEGREGHVIIPAVLENGRVGVIAGNDRIEIGAVAQIRFALSLEGAAPMRLARGSTWCSDRPPGIDGQAQRGRARSGADEKAAPRKLHAPIRNIATPCGSTVASIAPDQPPPSLCAHRSRTFARTPAGHPTCSAVARIVAGASPRLNRSTALPPPASGFTQTSLFASVATRRP